MRNRSLFRTPCVILLTLLVCFGTSACTMFRQTKKEIWSYLNDSCKSRAYKRVILSDYINKRFDRKAPVRMAVVPFSVPANLAQISDQQPGIGNKLAWQLHSELLSNEAVPIVEVFNRQDWPRKSEEFYTGNFGAISLADQAGYDLVLVGMVQDLKYQGSMSAEAKLIEVSSGITVWYGQSTVETDAPQYERDQIREDLIGDYVPRKPSAIPINDLVDMMSGCIASNLLAEEPAPL